MPQEEDRQAEDQHRLDRAQQQLAGRPVIGEAVALDLALPGEVRADARLRPEVVDPERDDGQQDVDDVDAEERAAVAVEARMPDGGDRGGSGAGPDGGDTETDGGDGGLGGGAAGGLGGRGGGPGGPGLRKNDGGGPRVPARPYEPTMGKNPLGVNFSRVWPSRRRRRRSARGGARRPRTSAPIMVSRRKVWLTFSSSVMPMPPWSCTASWLTCRQASATLILAAETARRRSTGGALSTFTHARHAIERACS